MDYIGTTKMTRTMHISFPKNRLAVQLKCKTTDLRKLPRRFVEICQVPSFPKFSCKSTNSEINYPLNEIYSFTDCQKYGTKCTPCQFTKGRVVSISGTIPYVEKRLATLHPTVFLNLSLRAVVYIINVYKLAV